MSFLGISGERQVPEHGFEWKILDSKRFVGYKHREVLREKDRRDL